MTKYFINGHQIALQHTADVSGLIVAADKPATVEMSPLFATIA